MHLQPLPALTDNYIWTLSDDNGRALVVDPGDAAPVLRAADGGLVPAAVLLTHHHADHIAGTAELLRRWPDLPVHAPVDERIELPCRRVANGDHVSVLEWSFEVLEIPGHTLSHIAYVGHGHLFCGDTLFSLGCGRMFEGTPAQMLASLDRLAALPAQTQVCCGHEYTLANAAFARAVDPDNPALRRRTEDAIAMHDSGRPTLPSMLADELAANPFLRVDDAVIRAAVARHGGGASGDRVGTFADLRRCKDGFRG
jgi:hydroxyacylglutathione hydrolase